MTLRFFRRALLFPTVLTLMLVTALTLGLSAPRTYTITDGNRVMTHTSFSKSPTQVLDEAGLELLEYDSYTTGEDRISIHRAQHILVRRYGETTEVSSLGETVGALLQRLEITLEPEDVLSYSLEEHTQDGMVLSIDRVVQLEQCYTAAIPHETIYCDAPDLPAGTEEVLVQGQDGETRITAQITYTNTRETGRTILSQSVTRSPITGIVALGTGSTRSGEEPNATVQIEDGYIRLPTGEVLTYHDTASVRATAYTHTDEGCDYITYTGTTVHMGTVAVDPRYIPYGTRMFIVSDDGAYVYGISVAEDCGGAIKGDRVDLYFPTYAQCMEFGWRNCTIYFLG